MFLRQDRRLSRRLRLKPFTSIAVIVFSLAALVQLLRVIFRWDTTVNGIFIPFWASVIACVVHLPAVMLWREGRA